MKNKILLFLMAICVVLGTYGLYTKLDYTQLENIHPPDTLYFRYKWEMNKFIVEKNDTQNKVLIGKVMVNDYTGFDYYISYGDVLNYSTRFN